MGKKKKVWNPIECEEYFKIPLSKGEYALIDKEDLYKVINYSWICQQASNGKKIKYAATKLTDKKRTTIYMARLILDVTDKNILVDHINHDGLDNRRCNIRKCTRTENNRNVRIHKRNTSGHIGISWCKDRNKWKAQIGYNNKVYNLGNYENKEDAIEIRENNAKQLFGIFYNKQQETIIWDHIH